jgi:rhamnogalacturonyl hydrolase YesR
MKRILFISALLLNACLITTVSAQNAKQGFSSFENFPANANPIEIGNRLVEHFLEKPHSTFGAFKATPATEITYPDACAWYGSLTFAKRTNNKDLSQRLIKRAELLLKEEAHLIPYAKDLDRAVIGIIPLEVYNQTKDVRFLQVGLAPADEQFKTLSPDEYAKLSADTRMLYSKGYSWHTRLWMDDMFMITSLQSQAFRATGDRKYIDRTSREMILYLDSLQTPNGLFYHAPDVPYYWGRGDGWLAAGMTELLNSLPQDNIYRPRILKGYKDMMQTLLKYQDKNGMWHQLLNEPSAWPETSSTAMFAFAFISGVKNGWLDEKTYGPAARKAWIALCTNYLDKNNDLHEICEGTNKFNDHQYYIDRIRITGDLHGQAPMIWCAMALAK